MERLEKTTIVYSGECEMNWDLQDCLNGSGVILRTHAMAKLDSPSASSPPQRYPYQILWSLAAGYRFRIGYYASDDEGLK